MSDVELTIDIQLKNANAKLDNMGKKLDAAALKGKKLGDANKKAASESAKAFAGMSNSLKGVAAGFVSIAAAQKMYQTVATSAKAMDTLAIFKAAGGSIEKLREQTRGLISDATLAKNANLARTMGISADEFAKLANIANAAAKATGESSEFMLESIVKGTARSSKLLLDNLGILVSVGSANEAYAEKMGKTVKSLTDAEKKQAFINATLTAGIPLINQAAKAGANNAEAFEQMSASADNVILAFGSSFRNELAATAESVGFLADEFIRMLNPGKENTGDAAAAQALNLRRAREASLVAANFAAGTEGKSSGELFAILKAGTGPGGIRRSMIPGAENAKVDAKNITLLARAMIKFSAARGAQGVLFKGPAAKKLAPGGGGKKESSSARAARRFAEATNFGGQDDGMTFDPLTGFSGDDESAGFDARKRASDFQAGIDKDRNRRNEAKIKADEAAAKAAEANRIEEQKLEFERLDAMEEARMLAADRVAAHQQAINDRLHAEAMGATRASIGIAVDLAQRATEMFMTGEEHALEQLAALGLARVGSEFVAKGSLFAAEGVGMAIAGNVPGGIALGALGAGMIGTGIAMGAGSMAISQSLPGASDAVSSGAVTNRGNGAENIGAATQTQIVVNYGVNGPHPDETAKAIVQGLNLAQRRGITATR